LKPGPTWNPSTGDDLERQRIQRWRWGLHSYLGGLCTKIMGMGTVKLWGTPKSLVLLWMEEILHHFG